MVFLDEDERDAAFLDRTAFAIGLLAALVAIASASGYFTLAGTPGKHVTYVVGLCWIAGFATGIREWPFPGILGSLISGIILFAKGSIFGGVAALAGIGVAIAAAQYQRFRWQQREDAIAAMLERDRQE